MANLTALSIRLAQAAQSSALAQQVLRQLEKQQYCARLNGEQVQDFCQAFHCDPIELALACLPLAAGYAQTPVSQFNVGAVAIGKSGSFYFGANQEYAQATIGQTLHAEQSATAHAWLAGEGAISHMVVNYTPCGHCRQFLNELNSADELHIHLPHIQYQPLKDYLPDAFGPKDLGISQRWFDQPLPSAVVKESDPLIIQAKQGLYRSYAPYSQAQSAVALALDNGEIVVGSYGENAAFNPSLLPLQCALNFQRLQGWLDAKPLRAVMLERCGRISHRQASQELLQRYASIPLEYELIDHD